MLNNIIAFSLIVIILFVSIYIYTQIGFFKKNFFFNSIYWLFKKDEKKSYRGMISPFESLSIALSGTVGIGNITGVIMAISLGGPGSVFWIWVSGILGMIVKFISIFISFEYRIHHMRKIFGGVIYTYKYQLKSPILGNLTAGMILFTALYTGNFIQSGEVIEGLSLSIPNTLVDNRFIISFFFCLATLLVIANGIKYIRIICSIIAPGMIIIYTFSCLWIIISYIDNFGSVLWEIVESASGLKAIGGGVGAYLWIISIKQGLLSGIFSNEAGFGSSNFSHILAKTSAFKQSMIAVLEIIIDTIVVCTLTALVVLLTNTIHLSKNPVQLIISSFDKGYASILGDYSIVFSSFWVGFILILFSYSTIIAWAYYGEQTLIYFLQYKEYEKRKWILKLYRIIYAFISLSGMLLEFNLKSFDNILYYMSFFVIVPHFISLLIFLPKVRKQIKKESIV